MRLRNKYRAKAVRYDGIYFPSTGEYNRYRELKLAQSCGEISDLVIHPRYPIVINDKHVCLVELDFSYTQNGKTIFEDFKGVYTSESRLRHKLFEAYYGAKVLITRAHSRVRKPRKRKR
jgi:hypothetical protein